MVDGINALEQHKLGVFISGVSSHTQGGWGWQNTELACMVRHLLSLQTTESYCQVPCSNPSRGFSKLRYREHGPHSQGLFN